MASPEYWKNHVEEFCWADEETTNKRAFSKSPTVLCQTPTISDFQIAPAFVFGRENSSQNKKTVKKPKSKKDQSSKVFAISNLELK